MSKFKPGDKVVLINVDQYSDIMKQLMGKALVVNSIDTDKCGCEIVCARVPGEEGWFLYSDDLRLVSEAQPEPATDPAPAAVAEVPEPADQPELTPFQIRRGDLVEYDGDICVVFCKTPDSEGDYMIASLTGEPDYYWANIDELTKIGSIRKKVKRLQAQKESRNAT